MKKKKKKKKIKGKEIEGKDTRAGEKRDGRRQENQQLSCQSLSVPRKRRADEENRQEEEMKRNEAENDQYDEGKSVRLEQEHCGKCIRIQTDEPEGIKEQKSSLVTNDRKQEKNEEKSNEIWAKHAQRNRWRGGRRA